MEETDELETMYVRAFEVLGYGAWTGAVPPLGATDSMVHTYALAQLFLRAAGLRARTIEASMTGTWRQDYLEDAACIATEVPDDDDASGRAFWEARRLAALLTRLDVGVQGDPYVAAAAAAADAAATLLFAPSRSIDMLEASIDGLARRHTALYLDQARDALRRALDAVDVACDKLGPDDPD